SAISRTPSNPSSTPSTACAPSASSPERKEAGMSNGIPRVVIVTGAGSGIGLCTAEAFLADGAHVVGAGLALDDFRALGPAERTLAVEVDLTDRTAAARVAAAAVERFGRIDVLFNNAALAPARSGILDVTDEEWDATLDLNL